MEAKCFASTLAAGSPPRRCAVASVVPVGLEGVIHQAHRPSAHTPREQVLWAAAGSAVSSSSPGALPRPAFSSEQLGKPSPAQDPASLRVELKELERETCRGHESGPDAAVCTLGAGRGTRGRTAAAPAGITVPKKRPATISSNKREYLGTFPSL